MLQKRLQFSFWRSFYYKLWSGLVNFSRKRFDEIFECQTPTKKIRFSNLRVFSWNQISSKIAFSWKQFDENFEYKTLTKIPFILKLSKFSREIKSHSNLPWKQSLFLNFENEQPIGIRFLRFYSEQRTRVDHFVKIHHANHVRHHGRIHVLDVQAGKPCPTHLDWPITSLLLVVWGRPWYATGIRRSLESKSTLERR